MVLCPREKNRPQVTGNWPRLRSPRVALSIALQRNHVEIEVESSEERASHTLCGRHRDLMLLVRIVYSLSNMVTNHVLVQWSSQTRDQRVYKRCGIAQLTQASRHKLNVERADELLANSIPAIVHITALARSSSEIRSRERPKSVRRHRFPARPSRSSVASRSELSLTFRLVAA